MGIVDLFPVSEVKRSNYSMPHSSFESLIEASGWATLHAQNDAPLALVPIRIRPSTEAGCLTNAHPEEDL